LVFDFGFSTVYNGAFVTKYYYYYYYYLLLTFNVTTLPLDALRWQMPSAMVLIYSVDVRSLLMIGYYLILLLNNSEILSGSYILPFMTLLL